MDNVDLELRRREFDEREARRAAYAIEQREQAEREAAEALAAEELITSTRVRRVGGSFIVPDHEPEPTPEADATEQTPPPAYRVMSDAERKPWDRWLARALRAEREKIFAEVAEGIGAAIETLQCEVERACAAEFATRKEVDELKAELLEVRALIHQRTKSWWR